MNKHESLSRKGTERTQGVEPLIRAAARQAEPEEVHTPIFPRSRSNVSGSMPRNVMFAVFAISSSKPKRRPEFSRLKSQ